MQRFFIEIMYDGSNYHGWQIQPNSITIQEQLEKAISTILNKKIGVVGAGRTDTGVHAKQFFAHFDCVSNVLDTNIIYRLNSFLPKDICIKSIRKVKLDAHCRFDALSRTYEYIINKSKNPFLVDKAKTNNCKIKKAVWEHRGETLVFIIQADRFLRNMVRAIVGTLIDVGLNKISIDDFKIIIKSRDRAQAGTSVPAHALYLKKICYPENIWL